MSARSITQLGQIATISSGGTPSRTKPSYWGGKIPWVKTTQIQNCWIYEHDVDEWITEAGLGNSSAKMYPKGTLLMAMYGQGKTRGQVAILGLNATINQACAAIELDSKLADRDFIYQQLLYKYETIRGMSNAGGQDNLSAGLIREIDVQIPPLPEQKAIADSLSTWDTAIETMERLIAAKESTFRHHRAKEIHQAAVMHKALCPLSQAFQPLTRKNTSGETNVLTTSAQRGLVSQQTYFSKSIASENLEGYFLVERGDFAFNRSSSNGYPYGAIKRLEDSERGVLSTLNICMSLREPSHLNSDFFVHVFEAGYLNRGLSQICQEGARSHGLLNVSREDFFGLEIPIPDKAAQDRIADKLNLVQSEVTLLRKQLDLLKLQKRGLMQKLLTGTWRTKEA